MAAAPAVPGRVVSDEVIPPGGYWHKRIPKGSVLRIVDVEGQQAVDALIYDAGDTSVRYNAANTMKLGGSVYVSKGFVLYDDLARPMMTLIEDTVGYHDTIGGNCSREINMLRYGKTAPNSCRDNFKRAMSELGMSQRDITANLNFFMYVPVDAKGHMAIKEGLSKPGDYVDLKSERDVIFVVSNCPQLYNPCCGGNPTQIRLTIWKPD